MYGTLDERESWNRQDIKVLGVFCESCLADTDPWVLGADHHATHAEELKIVPTWLTTSIGIFLFVVGIGYKMGAINGTGYNT